MNNFIFTSSTYPLTLDYSGPQSISGTLMPLVPAHKPSSSWRKFIHVSSQQSASESAVMFISAEKTTTDGPTVLKSAPLPKDYDAQVDEFLRFIDSIEPQTEVTNDIVAE